LDFFSHDNLAVCCSYLFAGALKFGSFHHTGETTARSFNDLDSEPSLRFGSFDEGEIPSFVGDTLKLPAPQQSEMVSINFRSISGGSITLHKPLHEVNLANLKKEIEHCDGIPSFLQRVTHRGKDLQEQDLRGLFMSYTPSAKEIEVSVTLRINGGMFGRSAKKVIITRTN
jgi:hypothetical protein